MSRTWADTRVLAFEVDHAAALLERGAALLDGLAEEPRPMLRWYRALEPALVLGRGQLAADVHQIEGLPIVTRYSGGGAVLLDDGLLSLDVVLPTGHPLLEGDLGDVFLRVGQAWATSLAALGLRDVAVHDGPAQARRRGSPRERLLAAVCYATLGRGEVLAGGRKLVGLAQRRRRQGALVQCGLLRRWQPQRVLAALGADPEDAEVAGAAVGLDELLPDPPSDEQVMAAVEAALGVRR